MVVVSKLMIIDLRQDPQYGTLVSIVQEFQEAIGRRSRVTPSQVRATNGATGGLSTIFNVILRDSYSKGKKPTAVVAIPEYFDALRMLELCGFDLHKVEGPVARYPTPEVMESLKNVVPSVFYLSLPNNPSGQLLPAGQLGLLLDAASPETTIVIDQTLVHPYKYSTVTDIQHNHQSKNIVIVNSFSKSHGLVAERVGYIIMMQPAIAQQIHPYAQVPGISALIKAIDFIDNRTMPQEVIEKESRSNGLLEQWSKGRKNLRYYHSLSGFSLIELHSMSSERCRESLDSRGYLVRSGPQLYLPDRFIRIDMSQPEHLPRFLETLDSIVAR